MEEGRRIQTCPAPDCNKTVNEQLHWVECPYFGYQPICITHCSKCKYHIDDEHCSYANERNNRIARNAAIRKRRMDNLLSGEKANE